MPDPNERNWLLWQVEAMFNGGEPLTKCEGDEEYCKTHDCGAHEQCMKKGCPHCDLPQNNYHPTDEQKEKNKDFARKIGQALDKLINDPTFVKEKLHERLNKEVQLTNKYLREKDRGEHENG